MMSTDSDTRNFVFPVIFNQICNLYFHFPIWIHNKLEPTIAFWEDFMENTRQIQGLDTLFVALFALLFFLM